MRSVRRNAVEGVFYASDPVSLKQEIASYLSMSRKMARTPVKMIITPHAGYSYSGKTAGAAFAEVWPKGINHVMLLGPSHRHYFQGVAESADDVWESPLGSVEIAPLNRESIIRNAAYHRDEHCLEVQIPFIKYLLPHARVSPLLISGKRTQALSIAQQLSVFDSDETLWVISSDFNHVGPSFQHIPEKLGYDSGKTMDQEAIRLITAGDTEAFSAFLENTRSTICGALPILVAMHLVHLIKGQNFFFKTYDCSGDQTGDINSVGYAALYC
ncbi:AmmeMemoRadiSam system protein B [bacterium]|nr:AmmeMemoRadiSam system protein B [bacterium]